ncbi:MAG: hypothetical protein ACP5NG_00535 [Conexivisphaera sp.]
MSRPSYGELLAIASVVASAVLATLSYYPNPDPGPAFAASGMLAVYAAATSVGAGAAEYALLSLIALLTALSPLLPPQLFALSAAASVALVLSGGGRRGAIALAASVAFSPGYPWLPALAAAGYLAAGGGIRRLHGALLPVGYAIAALVGYAGHPLISAPFSMASSSALAVYFSRGLSSCPLHTDRPLASSGVAALAAVALASPILPASACSALLAGSAYLLASGLLAPTGSSERGLSGRRDPGSQ